jgi:hypothetical protein
LKKKKKNKKRKKKALLERRLSAMRQLDFRATFFSYCDARISLSPNQRSGGKTRVNSKKKKFKDSNITPT